MFKPAGPLVYNSTPAFSRRKYTRNGIGYGLHPHKSSPPSSSSDRSVSWWINQTRWPPKELLRRQHGVCDSASQRLCQGIRVLKGGPRLEQLIIYMLMGRHHILYSARCRNPLCVSIHVCVCDWGREQGEGKSFFEMTCTAVILICSGEVFKLWKRCYYTLPQSRLCNVLFAMPGPDFAEGN